MNKRRLRLLLMVAMLFAILISTCDGVIFQRRYPEIRFNQMQLYGENGENLKDFALSGDGVLTATTVDPWITISLECAIPVAAIRIYASDVNDMDGRLNIFDTDSWQCKWLSLRNGDNTYQFYDHEDSWMTQNYRLDLVSVEGASCRVEYVTINPSVTVWIIGFIRCIVPSIIAALTVVALLISAIRILQNRLDFLKRGGTAARTVLLTTVCIGAAYLVLHNLRVTISSTNIAISGILLYLLYRVNVPHQDRRTTVLIGTFATVLAIANNYSSRIVIGNTPYGDLMDVSYVTSFGVIDTIGIPVLACVLYRTILVFLKGIDALRNMTLGKALTPCQEIGSWIPTTVIFICWLPYLILYYPGIILGDSTSQIYQAIGSSGLSNHHPVAHTLFIRACIWLGRLYGDLTFGCAVYSIVQMFLLAVTLGMMIAWLSRRHVSKAFLIGITVFMALSPFYGAMSIAMWKDPLFGAAAVALSLEIYDYIRAAITDNLNEQKRRLMGITICALIFVFVRNNGIYAMIVAMLLVAVTLLRKSRIRRSCIRLLAAMLLVAMTYGVVTGPVYTYCNVTPSEKVESVGLFLNQMAGVAAADDGVMSVEDKEYMNHLLPIEQYREKYRPCVVDLLKWDAEFDKTYLSEHMDEFYQTYISLGLKNPGKYINAWALQTFGYWSPNYWEFDHDNGNLSKGNFRDLPNSSLDIHQEPLYERPDTVTYRMFTLYGTMVSLGFVDWIMLFACLMLLIRRNIAGCMAMTISLGVMATLLIASPYYYWQRYGTAQYYLLPVFLYFIFAEARQTSEQNVTQA